MDSTLYRGEQFFLSSDFPLQVIDIKQNYEDPHYHDFYELVIILNGSGKHVTENLTYPVSVGDVFIIKPMVRHYYSGAVNLHLINVLFRPEILAVPQWDIHNVPGYYVLFEAEPELRKKGEFKSRLTLNLDQLNIVNTIVAKLDNELQNDNNGFRFMSIAYLMELMVYLSRCYTMEDNKFSRKLLRVSSMMNFITRNFHRKLSFEEIAVAGHMSLRSASRAFQDALKMTPVDYLIKIRIEHAAKLLKEQNLSITAAAGQSGFSDSNYFSKQFRKFWGQSPRTYKKMFESFQAGQK